MFLIIMESTIKTIVLNLKGLVLHLKTVANLYYGNTCTRHQNGTSYQKLNLNCHMII